MIQVRAEYHVLRRQLPVAAGQAGNDVAALFVADAGASGKQHRARQIEAAQGAGIQCGEYRVGGHVGAGKEFARGVGADRGGRDQLREGVQRGAVRCTQAHAGPRPVGGATRPWRFLLTGRIGNENRTDRAAFDQRGHLLAPRRIISARVVGEARRCATEQHRDLALEIDPGKIVVIELRRDHALRDEHQWRGQRKLGLVVVHAGEKLGFERQRLDTAIADQLEPRAVGQALALQQWHALKVAAVVAGRLQAERLKLAGHIARSNFVAARGRLAAFEQVIGQKRHVRRDALRRCHLRIALRVVRTGAGGKQQASESEQGRRCRIQAHGDIECSTGA